MSRIDDLIRDLCPDGVTRVPLVSLVRRNKGIPITATQMKKLKSEQGDVRVFAAGNTFADLRSKDIPFDRIIKEASIIVKSRGHIGFERYSQPFTHKNELWSYTSVSDDLNINYLYHLFMSKARYFQNIASQNSVKLPQLTVSDTDHLDIPLPPVVVQQEIAKKLDFFAQLGSELEDELEDELEARRQQFTYYRNLIVAGSQQAQLVPIKDIGKLQRGRRFTRNDMVSEGIPAIHYGEIYTTYGHKTNSTTSFVKFEIEPQLRFAQPGDVIIAAVGETVADVGTGVAWLGTTPVAYHDDSFALHHNQDPRYISHALRTSEYHRQKDRFVSRAKVKRLSAKGIEQIRIPLPPLDEQRRIADILDDFDALVNDLTSGLPAEIEARRKQYEYYRDRLLTFPEKK